MRRVSLNEWISFFFRAAGRISRAEYGLGIVFVYCIALAIIFFIAGQSKTPEISLSLLVNAPLLIALLVLSAKRCHDIGLPGSFVLLLVVPIAGVVWLVALALIPGKPGPNAYGPEPTYSS